MKRTDAIDLERHMAGVAKALRGRAMLGIFDGHMSPRTQRYMRRCSFGDTATGARLIFTRDTGHHTSGWWKNPDYERCFHLSTSPLPSPIIMPSVVVAELDKKTLAAWVRAFYGDDSRNVWAEPPYSDHGKRNGVWHWRLFCDETWRPILPRGEVYSLEFTEMGWRTASQVLEEDGA